MKDLLLFTLILFFSKHDCDHSKCRVKAENERQRLVIDYNNEINRVKNQSVTE